MNFKTWFPLVLAIVLGLVAMKVARDVISKNQSGAPATAGTQVVVVKDDLPAGAELTVEALTTTTMSGEVNTAALFTDPAVVKGRVLATPIAKGTPVSESLLAPSGVGRGLQALIPAGMRAITIEINEFSGVAGNLIPGCRVDVVATINAEGGETASRTVVQNVKVQSLGMRQTEGDPAAPMRSVTLLASPKEAEAIELAAATGKPRLVLRNGTDSDTALSAGVTLAELRRGGTVSSDPFEDMPVALTTQVQPPATQPTAQAEQPRTQPVTESRPWRRAGRQIKIIRGGVETEVTVEELATPVGPRWITNAPTEELEGTSQN